MKSTFDCSNPFHVAGILDTEVVASQRASGQRTGMAGRTGGFSFFSNILIAVVQSPLVTDQLSKHWSDFFILLCSDVRCVHLCVSVVVCV